jgi:hypothetical protein
MKKPPFRCLYCLSTSNSFQCVEHPIPESLGNDDLHLPQGVVCDSCNQYFGAKLEKQVLACPPFSIERLAGSIRTKKGKFPRWEGNGLSLFATGYWDQLLFISRDRTSRFVQDGILEVPAPSQYADLMARFLLKLGLGLLATQEEGIDPYASRFDAARTCARHGKGADAWDVGYGRYPRRHDLILGTREDEYGPIEKRQVYQYEMGVMADGDVVFFFTFFIHCFACNLSQPGLSEYLRLFNALNEFTLQGRFGVL